MVSWWNSLVSSMRSSVASNYKTLLAAASATLGESQRIILRVGINLGDVIVEGNDIYGDGVNVAARLMQ
jgi:class 3 adenylate cyclase